MKARFVFVVWAALCAAGLPAHGQPADALKKAQSAFDQAQLDYLQGKYDEAAQGFQDAYAAREFPQFLYNVAASFHMKGKKASDVVAYGKAVDFYRQYLAKDPQAADKPKVEKAIGVLEAEIQRLKSQPTEPGAGSGSGSAAPTPAAPSAEVQSLGDVKVRGLVVIESEPSNAAIYLDDKRKGQFATTPWSGELEGDHKIIIEKRGYMVVEKTIAADPSKVLVVSGAMSQQSFLGWIEISSNVPGSDVFIDDKSIGAVGKTPFSQNIKPGKHTFWVSAEGYDEYKEDAEVIAGETHTVKAALKGSPVGRLSVVGAGIEDATILVDGKQLCERGPCLKSVPEGDHILTVTREDFKSYTQRIRIQAKTETQVKVSLAPTPSRKDAFYAYGLAVAFGVGGIVLGVQANGYRDDIKKQIAAGNPPPDSNDPRFVKGKAFAIAADATFVIAGLTALTGIYYTFRDKGAPSQGTIEIRSLALRPEISKTYAGLGMEVQW